jgi:hypothetical protein
MNIVKSILSIVSGVVLIILVSYTIWLYIFTISYVGRGKPHLFSIRNIIYFFQYGSSELVTLLILIPIFFIIILYLSKK